jgi:hypothetical protein
MTDMELNFGKPIPKAQPATYPAMLVGIEPFVINEGTPEAKTLIRWAFSLDDEIDPETNSTLILDGVTSTATGPKSKMRPWVTALLGRSLDEAVTLSALKAQAVGRPCLVVVDINDDGYSKVFNVIPPAKVKPAPAAAAQPGEFDGAPVTPKAASDADSLPF